MSWVATSRKPVDKDLDGLKPPDGLTSLSKAERKQFDAAKDAVAKVIAEFDGEVNVAISGDVDEAQIHVHVAAA